MGQICTVMGQIDAVIRIKNVLKHMLASNAVVKPTNRVDKITTDFIYNSLKKIISGGQDNSPRLFIS